MFCSEILCKSLGNQIALSVSVTIASPPIPNRAQAFQALRYLHNPRDKELDQCVKGQGSARGGGRAAGARARAAGGGRKDARAVGRRAEVLCP